MNNEKISSTEQDIYQSRLAKLKQLQQQGVDPFGQAYQTTHSPHQLYQNFTTEQTVSVAGRILAIRTMGKSVFFTIGDIEGKIQCYLQPQKLAELAQTIWKNIDIGDWIGVEGTTFYTKKEEATIRVSDFTILAKSLRSMPDKWKGIADQELKYRKRHLDLIGNPESARIFKLRSKIISEIRRFFEDRDFVEVETPMLHGVAGGAAARPFETHHNTLNMPLNLRIAPELHLKRLLCGGFTRVFELNRNFRNEGISRRHNPEFTMLEAYCAFADFTSMADLVEELVCHLAMKFFNTLQIEHKDKEGKVTRVINLQRPWKRLPYRQLICEAAGNDWFELTPQQRRQKCTDLGVEISDQMEDYEVTQQVFEKLVEEHTFDPCFVTHVAKELIPLAKLNKDDDSLIDVYELIINGQEISPGYSELNDPILQRQRFADQAGGETQNIDEQFIETMECGMPPAGGIGIGIDRLIMLLVGATGIRDVILFPQLKDRNN